MDRLDAMQVMLTAVECGSLSKASRKLGQPLGTVSRKVSELERHLKADLLIRSSKGLELTPAGRSYVTAARTILEQLNEAERAAAGEYTEPRGDLVVTAPTMFGRLHVVPRLRERLTSAERYLIWFCSEGFTYHNGRLWLIFGLFQRPASASVRDRRVHFGRDRRLQEAGPPRPKKILPVKA